MQNSMQRIEIGLLSSFLHEDTTIVEANPLLIGHPGQFGETSNAPFATTSLPERRNQFESRNRSGAALLTVHFGGREGNARDAKE
jgi:hypothetical protein